MLYNRSGQGVSLKQRAVEGGKRSAVPGGVISAIHQGLRDVRMFYVVSSLQAVKDGV